MKKKRTILAILIVAIIIIVLCLVKYYCDNQSIKSFAAIGCSVQELSTSNGVSSLKIILDDDENTAKTIALDDDIVEKVKETDVKDIIGVNVVSDIPKKLLEEKHINIKSIFNPMQLLAASDEYDKYFEIVDISFSEQHSFVGKVIEETTTYMIVEPTNDEYERTIAERIKIEYGTDHIDYLYGTGRMVVIYYKGDINTADGNMASIKSDDISTEGFREWEMKVVPSNEPNNKKIMEKTQPHDSDTTSHWYKQYNLYYHGLEDVIITVDGEQHSLAHALKRGKITMSAILAKANQDVSDGIIDDLRYKDGGSAVFKYPDYTIVKYHTLDGNDDMYIGTPDIDIYVKDK